MQEDLYIISSFPSTVMRPVFLSKESCWCHPLAEIPGFVLVKVQGVLTANDKAVPVTWVTCEIWQGSSSHTSRGTSGFVLLTIIEHAAQATKIARKRPEL